MAEPRTILETLGQMPLSGQIRKLTVDAFATYIRQWSPSQASEERRRKEARKRLDLYRDRADNYLNAIVEDLFVNDKVRKQRKKFLKFAKFQNVTKRVIREISTVYSEEANRTIAEGTEGYREFQRRIRQDRAMRTVNRYGNLTNDLLVWPDVDARRGPVQRIVTQDKFTAIPHPLDPLDPVAFVIDQFPTATGTSAVAPHYLVITEFEFVKLDKNWRVIETTWREHGLGRMPALLWHREQPDDRLLDADSGGDLISAHLAVALLNTLMLKHQKSGTRLPYASGDTSDVARGQAMDEESLMELGEGVTLNTLDLGANPQSYIDATRAVIKQIAANYGIPESVFDLSYQATSGFEIELKRTGLREVRKEQALDFRPFERELSELWSTVLTKAQHPWAFKPDGWAIEFGEMEVSDPMAEATLWQKWESMDLTNRVQMYMWQNPEATEEQALKQILVNRQMRLDQVRAFQSGQANPEAPAPGNSPGGQPIRALRVSPEPDDDESEAAA